MTPRRPFHPGYLEVGFTTRLWGSPLTPEAVFSEFSLFKKTKNKNLVVVAPFTSPSTYPSTDGTKNNGLFSCASAPLRALWLGSAAGLRFQPHVLHSNQKSQAWQYGHIAGGDTEKKYKQRRRRGETLGWRSVKKSGSDVKSGRGGERGNVGTVGVRGKA